MKKELNQNSFPVVSVLMTAYNREKYIAEAIESVLSSGFQNFELLIVDDGSTDNTVSIAREFVERDKRIKLFVNSVNQGQFANRNIAASYATGKYIKYLDSDDVLYPFSLQIMVEAMELFPDAGLGFCLTHGPCKKPLPYIIPSNDALQQHFFEGGLLFCGPSGLIFRRKAFESVGGFEEFGMPSDNHLTLKIASRFPVVAMTRDLFWWRIHPEQVFTRNEGNYLNILNNYAYTKSIVTDHSCLNEREKKTVLINQKKIFFRNLFRLIFRKGKPGQALDLLLRLRQ